MTPSQARTSMSVDDGARVDVGRDRPPFAVSEPPEPAYARSPVTVARLGISLVVLAFMYLSLQGADAERFTTGFSDLLDSLPHWLVSGIVSICQIAFLVAASLGFIAELVLRHFRRVARMLLAAGVCIVGLIAMSKLVGVSTLPLVPPGHGEIDPTRS